ncbi:MAG TPA: 2-hydroxyacyl-CoA dehydratase family protein [Spirochaetota bacterium]|nr:2-hydroxyacyl-CoA dehydratase family protein [Spirochaetota bacterium]
MTEIFELLHSQINNYEEYILKTVEEKNRKPLGYVTPLLPPEIFASFDIDYLKIPEEYLNGTKDSLFINKNFMALITPYHRYPCSRSFENYLSFDYPGGFGEDAAVELHNKLLLFLQENFQIDLKSINIEKLQSLCRSYEELRRNVRKIFALKNEGYPISQAEIKLLLDLSLIFPPQRAIETLKKVEEILQKKEASKKDFKVKALIFGARHIPEDILDYIERGGIAPVEDDTCSGSRLFDISLNSESPYIFYELLEAYSYRPMQPCIRKVQERFELLYKLLKNYGIETVIFYIDESCPFAKETASFLRIKMMRSGIDPLVIDRLNYQIEIDRYVSLL